jgi:hypothetical protein
MFNRKNSRRDFFTQTGQWLLAISVMGRGIQLGGASARELIAQNSTTPTSFTRDEFEIIKSIASVIIPTDQTPGANEAGIAEYLAQFFQQQGTATVTAIKTVLNVINQQAQQLFGVAYNSLNLQQKQQLVQIIATNPVFAQFWGQFRGLTVLRFYSLPQGYLPAGLPGPNVDKGGFPFLGC